MSSKIFVAGAAGAIGLRLSRLLVSRSYEVVGTTRSDDKAAILRALGVEPVIVDVFDAERLARSVKSAAPDVVMHQLTDLSGGFEASQLAETLARNARIRREGTANLVQAALAAGAPRMIAQSIAWIYRPGQPPYREDDPLREMTNDNIGVSLTGVMSLETQVLHTSGIVGTVLRYGYLYGPGTGNDKGFGPSTIHVDAAASAALLAAEHGASGIYNIAEPGGEADSSKARKELGWSPDFRIGAD
jgi:nucleoside-diphosphate-sugar epimerase